MSSALVTGASGYLATRIIADLLRSGIQVRGTVRSLASEPEIRTAVHRGGADGAGLELFVASLTSDAGWAEAVRGVDGVHHVASPMVESSDLAEVVVPARDGTLRVLRAARDGGVPRVVLTSSFAAVGYSPKAVRDFDEDDWTDPATPGLSAYQLSKTIAERAAWDFVQHEGAGTELVVINPTRIAGPTLTRAAGSSLKHYVAMLSGDVPPDAHQRFGIVDVRDVAALHLAAMATPAAAGRRYVAVADGPTMTFAEVSDVLRARSDALVSAVPVLMPSTDEPAPLVIRNDRARRELGFRPRPSETTIIETAESIRDLGMLGVPR